jgi:hypothetical protein
MNQSTEPAARGRPFPKGNGGRKPGSKNRTTQVAEALLAGEEEELVRKAVEIAKAGDVSMLKFLLGRILPRERSIKIDLPSTIYERDNPMEALAEIIRAVAEGKISPSEGAALATMIPRKCAASRANRRDRDWRARGCRRLQRIRSHHHRRLRRPISGRAGIGTGWLVSCGGCAALRPSRPACLKFRPT